MSTKKHTQKEIGAYLKTQLPELEFFDKYRGQLENMTMFSFPRPAIFMSFGRFEWNTLSSGLREGKGLIKFRIVVENYAESFSGSINEDLALQFFDFNQSVNEKLQGLSGTYFSSLDLKSDEDDEDHGNVIVTIMEYATTLIDNSTSTTKNYILQDPELNVEYLNKEDFPATPDGNPEDAHFIIPK